MLNIKRAGIAFLAFMLLLIELPAAAMVQPAQPSKSTDQPVPSGLVVVIRNTPQSGSLDLQALKNPYISGGALRIHWSDREPVERKPDWSKLDALFAAAESSKKWVQLCIYPGFFTPAWALKGVQTDLFPIPYGPYIGKVEKLPMPWDTVYLNRWFAFLKLLSDRYEMSSAFRVVAVDGPTSVSPEFTLPNSPQDLKQWQNDGYTPSKYLGAWQQVFQAYAADFPHQYFSLATGSGLSINDQGKIAPSEHLQMRQALVNEAIGFLGRRFALEMDDVHAGLGAHTPNSQREDKFIIGYNGHIITGFQMRTSAELDSRGMGAVGDPPLALQRSIDFAMQPNSVGQHVNYLEIYEPDVLANDLQSVLRYGASLFASGSPILPQATSKF